MTAMRIFCVGCAVPLLILGYEMLVFSGFSKYGTFTLKVKISWNAVNVGDLRIVYNYILYLSFPKMCFAGMGTLAELMQVCNPLVIKSEKFFHG
jgi:ABC-type microcin C transport system permease subunit YejB